MSHATEKWRSLLRTLLAFGDEIAPESLGADWRGRTNKELLGWQTRVPMSNPVVLCPVRKLGYRFMAAEAAAILSGDNRLETIRPFAKQMDKLSEDNLTMTGHYGPPFRDQISYILAALRKDPASRQAICALWRPRPALGGEIPCLAGDTKIWSPEGNLTISELASKFSAGLKRYPVLSFNPMTRNVEMTWCIGAWRSGIKSTIQITFDDASSIRVTSDHLFYKKIGPKKTASTQEIKAIDLKIGDSIWATTIRYSGKKQRPAFVKNLLGNNGWHNETLLHQGYAQLLWGIIPEGHDIHHKDGDVYNNKSNNLEILPHKVHSAMKMMGDDNPMRRETDEAKYLRRQRLRQTYADRGLNVTDQRFYELPAGDKGRKLLREMTREERHRHRVLMVRAMHERLGHDVAPLEIYDDPIRYATWKKQRGKRRRQNNHVIVDIKFTGIFEPVYDFVVPSHSNAIMGTGIVVHNCTLTLQWLMRAERLHCLVSMRSSDAWMGLPYDWFAFSMMSAYLAIALRAQYPEIELGDLTVTAGSQHLYLIDHDLAKQAVDAKELIHDIEPMNLAEFDHPNRLIDHLWAFAQHESLERGWLKEFVTV